MIYLDEILPHHPKIVQAGQLIGGKDGRLVALGLYVEAITYARHQVTDGVVPAPVVEEYRRRPGGRYTPATALVKVGLFEVTTRGRYLIHDYHDWNPTAAQVKEARRLAREKKAKWRSERKGVPGGVPKVSREDSEETDEGQGGTPDVPGMEKIHDPRSTIHDPVRTETTVPSEREQPPAETAAPPLSPTLNEPEPDDEPPSPFDSPVFDPPPPRRHEALARAPKGDNYQVIARIVREALKDGTREDELVEEVKVRAARLDIDYGRISGATDVVQRAVEAEVWKAKHPELMKS